MQNLLYIIYDKNGKSNWYIESDERVKASWTQSYVRIFNGQRGIQSTREKQEIGIRIKWDHLLLSILLICGTQRFVEKKEEEIDHETGQKKR